MVMAAMEVAGMASIMPFMALVADPGLIHRHNILSGAYFVFGFSSDVSFLYFSGFAVLGILVCNNLFSALSQWLSLRVTALCGHTLSERLFASYLSQPYLFFLQRNTSELANNLFSEVNRLVLGVLFPSIEIFAKIVVIFVIMALLLIIDVQIALCVAVVIGVIYALIFKFIRGHLSRIGRETVAAGSSRSKIAIEVLNGIKEIKIIGKESYYLHRYSIPSSLLAKSQASSQALARIPKYLLEIVAFGGILLITLLLLGRQQALSQILPVLAVYAVAGYRLLPAIQQTYSNIAVIRFNMPALEVVFRDVGSYSGREVDTCEEQALRLRNGIAFVDVTHSYPGATSDSIKDMSFFVPAKSTVAFVGPTGAGKTTTVDILLGLYEPQCGSLQVDGVTLNATNLRAWQRTVGYVPQQIYLFDDTIARNIALGEDDMHINMLAVEKAARTARIHDFIVKELPLGYQTVVGERGIRLSGGQRQRLGIARALYRDPEVLVMDEATSSLDGITESAIVDTLVQLANKKTIIMIAHRISTVRGCDKIFILENGMLAAQGNYDELMRNSELFRNLCRTGETAKV